MIEEILQFDTELFVYLNSLGSTNFDFFWLSLSRPEANIILYLLVLMLYISIEPNKKSFVINLLLSIIILVTISDQFSNISKDFFQRLRPCFNESLIDSNFFKQNQFLKFTGDRNNQGLGEILIKNKDC